MMENLTPAQLKQIEETKKAVLNSILSREAAERLGRIRIVNPNLAGQVELYLFQLYQAGRIKSIITDDKMKEILRVLTERRDVRIKRI